MSTDDASHRASWSDPARFEAVFDQHHGDVWSFIARCAGRQVADDLAGQVFVVAFERRASFDPALGEVRGWLFGIARNLVRTRRRSDGRRIRAFARMANQRHQQPDESQHIVDADELRVEQRLVLAALQRLSEDDRELLVLAVWEGLSYTQIAAVIGVPIGTVRSRLSRARKRLRELVERSGEEHGMTEQQDRTG